MIINLNGDSVETLIAQATQLQVAIGKMQVALGNAKPHGRNQPDTKDEHLYGLAKVGLKMIEDFNDHFTAEIGRQM